MRGATPRQWGSRVARAAALLLCLVLSACAAAQGEAPQSIPAPLPGGPSHSQPPLPPGQALPTIGCPSYERELFAWGVAAAPAYVLPGPLQAGMVPHHLVAADMIGGFFALAATQDDAYDSVLIVSPSHFPENASAPVVTALAHWDTPFGPVFSDEALTRYLLGREGLTIEDNPPAVEADHGVTGLVPFAAWYLPGARVSALLLSSRMPRPQLEQVWQAVSDYCAQNRVLLVVSVDCSHYQQPQTAQAYDLQTAAAIEALAINRVLSFDDHYIDSPQALTTLLFLSGEEGLSLERLDHSSSAHKLPHAASNPAYAQGVTSYMVYGAYFPDERPAPAS